MKQLYRVLPIFLSVGILGCNNTSTPENATATNTSEKGQEEFVSSLPDSAPVLKVATTGTLAPYSFQDDYGNMQGIDIDIIRAIGEEQGFKVEFYKETWQELFESVASGNRDLAVSGVSYSDERAEKYGLSTPYLYNPSAIMYMNDGPQVNTLEDIKGLRVAVLDGSKQVDQAQAVGGYSDLVTTMTGFLLFENLIQKKVDAVLLDAPILQYTAKNYPQYKVTIVPYEGKDDPAAQIVVLMAKNNDKLINNINEGIASLKQEGTIEKIEARWLSDIASPATDASSVTEQAN